MAEKLFVIKSPNTAFKGFRNAGSLSLSFQEGVSAPIEEAKADIFMLHFGKSGYAKAEYVPPKKKDEAAPPIVDSAGNPPGPAAGNRRNSR